MRGLSRSARMALRREQRRKGAGELNLVSMIDILTVLVFFLLVNSTGVAILGINLPDASQVPTPDQNQQPLTMVMRTSGFVLVQGNTELGRFGVAGSPVDYAAITNKLREVKAAKPEEKRITLLLEPSITHDALVQTMDAVRLTKSEDGRSLYELFPAIVLGDAPKTAQVAGAGVAGAHP